MCKKDLDVLSLNAEGMTPNMFEVAIPELNATQYVIVEDENVVYIQCPHCRKGYIAKLVSLIADTDKHVIYELKVRTHEGEIDLTKKQFCYDCENVYVPVTQARVIRTGEFAMRKVMEIKGS